MRRVDADNRGLDTDFDFVDFILPGEKTAIHGRSFSLPSPIAGLELEGSWDQEHVLPSEVGSWIVTDVAVQTERRRTNVTGDISSTFAETMERVQVVAVFLEDDGSIVAADYTYVSEVFSDRKAFFDISAIDVPTFEEVEVYVQP